MKKALMLTSEALEPALSHSELSHSFIVMTTEVERCVHAYSVGEDKGHDVIRYAFSLLNMDLHLFWHTYTMSACIDNADHI